ncbi:transporter substrate-binding domain-containing protein [soil metagenome]
MRTCLLVYLLFLALAGRGVAADQPTAPPVKLKVGVFAHPPFAMKDDDGRWQGIAVDLWERVSHELNLPYEYVETPLENVFPDLNAGKLDLALGEVGVTPERERLADFTQPFIATNIAVAIPTELSRTRWGDVWNGLIRNGLFEVIFAMFGTLVVFSLILWFIERRVTLGHFGGNPIRGFGSALWFSAVTMTTVGYGDKTPQTGLGRLLALIWMFLGILLVSAFTGSVASTITLSSMQSSINNIHDLSRFRNGVAEGSTAEEIVGRIGVQARKYSSVEEGLKALSQKQITAFISDDLTLKYLISRNYPDSMHISVIPSKHLTFAMAARPNLPCLQDLNIPITEMNNRAEWQEQVNHWLGSSGD